MQVSFVGIRFPTFGANKSLAIVSGGQVEVHVLSTIVTVSNLTTATGTIGAHLAKTHTLPVKWFE